MVGLAINWHVFGSGGHEQADYSRDVIERFTRRSSNKWASAKLGNSHVKTIANPRKIEKYGNPHHPNYYKGVYAVNENRAVVSGPWSYPVSDDKIILNHYHTKSREEYRVKRERGRAAVKDVGLAYTDQQFKDYDKNEEFDDGILKYREARAKVYQPLDNSHVEERLLSALGRNLSRQTNDIETLLTCRAVAEYLKQPTYEEAALKATLKALANTPSEADAALFKQELPKILELPYPVVEELREM